MLFLKKVALAAFALFAPCLASNCTETQSCLFQDETSLVQVKAVLHPTQSAGEKPLPEHMNIKNLRDDKDHSAALQNWFETNGISNQVWHLQFANAGYGDGTVDDAQWPYLASKCMQRRQMAVAHEVLKQGCEHVVEVGGYLKPVDALLRDLAVNSSYRLPKSYLNLDPSVNKAMDVTVGGMRSVHIPMTVADFTAADAMPFRKAFDLTQLNHSTGNICAVILGLWDPHVRSEDDRTALLELFRHVSLLACSVPRDEMEHFPVLKRIAEEAHNLRPTQKEQVFECSKELRDDESHWPGDEVERLFYLSGPDTTVSK